MSEILRGFGLDEGLQEDHVREAWTELAGDFIARNSQPVSVRKGLLVLRMTQPAMRFHLEQMKPMLLERLQAHLGKDRIHAVKFTLG